MSFTRKKNAEHVERFTQQDLLAASIRTTLALTGPIGPILAEFLTQFVPSQRVDRLHDFTERLGERVTGPRGAISRTDPHQRGVNVMLSIKAIDFDIRVIDDSGYDLTTLRLGALMREAGYVQTEHRDRSSRGGLPWFGSITATQHRLKVRAKRRAAAQSQLDAALRDVTVTT